MIEAYTFVYSRRTFVYASAAHQNPNYALCMRFLLTFISGQQIAITQRLELTALQSPGSQVR